MTTVKHFHSAMSGAPVLNGTAGSLIAVLDACLQDGFGLKAASGITVASGVATVTFANGHSFEPDTIALIAGATPGALNGEKVVLTTSTNAITFAAPGVPDGAATGQPYFTIRAIGWGTGWAVGNALRINTVGALFPVWVVRTIQQGAETVRDDKFTLIARGDVDRPPATP